MMTVVLDSSTQLQSQNIKNWHICELLCLCVIILYLSAGIMFAKRGCGIDHR